MAIAEKITKKIAELISAASNLKLGNTNFQVHSPDHQQKCIGWLASAQNAVHLTVSNPSNPYRVSVDRICGTEHNLMVQQEVGKVSAILDMLQKDIQQGLLTSIEDQTRAAVFDDFLDHAKHYAQQGHKNEAGVIAGVVFEDTLRNICRITGITEEDRKLDGLIDELVKAGTLAQVKAKRAKVAAHVRTKATHA